MRTALIVSLALQELACGGSSSAPRGRVCQFNYENVLGTSLERKIEARSASEAERADAAVRQEIEREAGILSASESSSEFSCVTAKSVQKMDSEKEDDQETLERQA